MGAETAKRARVAGRGHAGSVLGARPSALRFSLQAGVAAAWQREIDERRLFLWLPVAAGAGASLYMAADQEPVLWVAFALVGAAGVLATVVRGHAAASVLSLGVAFALAGFASAAWRSARVAAPILDHVRIVHLTGFIEEMDFRRTGARFLLRVASAPELPQDRIPFRVRLTTKRPPEVDAGAFVTLAARLVPPAHAALPGGYNFARDAYFERIGAVGSLLGGLKITAAPAPPDGLLAAEMALDRFRNGLARRIDGIVGGNAGAIAAAMVTGKRDLISDETKDLIREAGIFHIITISGVQITLVTAILFFALRRLLALSRTLALTRPIKKWAALGAMVGACAYDLATGSRVGTERALFMTLIMLTAVVVDRRAFTMRNLAYAALFVIAFEPEAIFGASFQLSFAAVAALVAVYEARAGKIAQRPPGVGAFDIILRWLAAIRRLLVATACATCATASFMAANFHELSPYVLIGNPLTLGLIELFAVPGALIGTALVPLGLDAPVWAYLGVGIRFILAMAGYLAAIPGATLHLEAFAPWALMFLSLGVLSAVIWRSTLLRLTAVPLFSIGLLGAAMGPRYDVLIVPSGDAVAIRGAQGKLGVVAPRANVFAAEQWLAADGDATAPVEANEKDAHCDKLGCVAHLADGRALSLVMAAEAFEEDCMRAAILVTRLTIPSWCTGPLVVDGDRLSRSGATALILSGKSTDVVSARSPGTDRPWAPAPAPARLWEPPEPRDPDEAGTEDDAVSAPPPPAEPGEYEAP